MAGSEKMVLEGRRWGNEMTRTIRVIMRLMELQIIHTKETLIATNAVTISYNWSLL